VSNHTTRSEVPCLRAPPPGGSTGGIPSWALPAAVVLTAGDAASSLIDPALPFIAAGAVVATVATGGWGACAAQPCKSCVCGAWLALHRKTGVLLQPGLLQPYCGICAALISLPVTAAACRCGGQQLAAASAQAAAGAGAGGAGHSAEAAGAGALDAGPSCCTNDVCPYADLV